MPDAVMLPAKLFAMFADKAHNSGSVRALSIERICWLFRNGGRMVTQKNPVFRYLPPLVEDELLIALMVEDFLVQLGCKVLPEAASVEQAGWRSKLSLRMALVDCSLTTVADAHSSQSTSRSAAMTEFSRDIYNSPNGDHWTLVRLDDRVMVRHQANASSGGTVTDVELLDFLKAGGLGPEKQKLLQLIGTLVERDAAAGTPGALGESLPRSGHAS